MGSVPEVIVTDLRDALGLVRAVETGTYLGDGARRLAALFRTVVTIELSPELAALAAENLSDCDNVRVEHGDSRAVLPRIIEAAQPTLYFLDGHWSAGNTAGATAECPVLEELEAMAVGHPDDCVVIDDARMFIAAPPPPHDPRHWPSLTQIEALVAETRRRHALSVVRDQIIVVPDRAQHIVDRHADGARVTLL